MTIIDRVAHLGPVSRGSIVGGVAGVAGLRLTLIAHTQYCMTAAAAASHALKVESTATLRHAVTVIACHSGATVVHAVVGLGLMVALGGLGGWGWKRIRGS